MKNNIDLETVCNDLNRITNEKNLTGGIQMSKKTITLKQFADELELRLKAGKTIDCCHDELIRLAQIVREKLPGETIEVDWKE